MTLELSALTSSEIAAHAAAGGVLVVPVGSTEQHGPHLPVGTDTDVALAVCRRVAGRLPAVVVAPVVAYGASGEHAGFAGTLSIGQEALELMLIELGRSAGETYRRQVFANAHGGNAGPCRRAVTALRAESRDVLLWMASGYEDAHAGRTETSLQLALHPDRVRAERAAAGNVEPIGALLPRMMTGGVAAVSPNGVLGDPAGASAAQGEALLARLADDLEAAVRTWSPVSGPLGMPGE
jgi:creatinine amidohydrolase